MLLVFAKKGERGPGWTFSSSVSPQGVLGGVGGHCQLREGEGAGVASWEELVVIVSFCWSAI
jgi:hypothetical protein